MYRVSINGNRPDFRVFIDLLYGVNRNVDTDGDSVAVNSRVWSYLYIADRESDDPPLDISALTDETQIFIVESKSEPQVLTTGHSLDEPAALSMRQVTADWIVRSFPGGVVKAADGRPSEPSTPQPRQ